MIKGIGHVAFNVKDMEKTEIYPANKEMIRMFLEGRV